MAKNEPRSPNLGTGLGIYWARNAKDRTTSRSLEGRSQRNCFAHDPHAG